MKTENLSVEPVDNAESPMIWSVCDELAKKMSYPSFFCGGAWLKTAAANVKAGEETISYIVKDNKSIRAVLPLVKKHNPLGGYDLRFLGSDFYPDPIGVICAPSDRSACVEAIKKYLTGLENWDRLILDCVLEDEAEDWKLPAQKISCAPYTPMPDDFKYLQEEFKNQNLFSLKSMIRKRNKFLKEGGQFFSTEENSNYSYLLNELFRLKNKRAAIAETVNTFTGARVEKFHNQLVKESDCVRFYGLLLDGKIIAIIYGFEFERRFFYYQIVHDPDYSAYSPGSVLIYHLMQTLCSHKIIEFNFLQGDEQYKRVWASHSRDLYHIVYYRESLRSKLFNVMEKTLAIGKKAKKSIVYGN